MFVMYLGTYEEIDTQFNISYKNQQMHSIIMMHDTRQ